MRAIVMSAGLGTRLRPLTDTLPKPLVPLLGRPMIAYVLDHIARHGITEALINIHYLPEKMRAFVAEWNAAGNSPKLFIQDESQKILDSGGGVAQAAAWLFEKQSTALVCNSDVIAAPDITALANKHRALVAQGVECTLTVMDHPDAGKKFNGLRTSGDYVLGFERFGTNLQHFIGYYLVEETAVKRLPAAGEAFSVVEKSWQPLAALHKLGAYRYEGEYLDLGTVEDLRAAERALNAGA